MKGSAIPTSTGLLFVNTADRKIHVYDSSSGKQLAELKLGGPATSLYDVRESSGPRDVRSTG